MRLQRRERRVGLSQRSDDGPRLAVLAQRQVAAIAAWVGDQLVGFVQRLGDVEGFLGTEAELLRADFLQRAEIRSEEHTSELQSLMRISSAVFCLKKKNTRPHIHKANNHY